MKSQSVINRRNFIGQACCSAVGSVSVLSTLLNLRLMNGAVAACNPPSSFSDYKALVCLFQLGGNDSFNMLVPRNTTGYAEYQTRRQNLALAQGDLLNLTFTDTNSETNGWQYGVHPSMPKLRTLFNNSKAAFVANVGTLVEPIANVTELATKEQPLGLYSHSDQIQHWQTTTPQSRASVGWAGRIGDIFNTAAVGSAAITMNIGVGGSNYFLSGNSLVPYTINANGAIALTSYNTAIKPFRAQAVDDILAASYANIFDQTLVIKRNKALDAYDQFSASVTDLPQTTADRFTAADSDLADQLHMVAKIIQARASLGAKRQIFFVSMGGWDHHDEVLNNQLGMLAAVDNAVRAFYDATVDLGVDTSTTLFSSSDFARTLTSNGNGSDHAWGSNVFVVGGAVKGKKVYGQFPRLYDGYNRDTGRGRFIPSTSVDQYGAELASWFGVSDDCLSTVFPNWNNFVAAGRPDFL